MSKVKTRNLHAEEQDFNKNTDLCMDVKTILRGDRRTQQDKAYRGMLMRDSDVHYTFVEAAPSSSGKRNPHIFEGRYVNVAIRDDGSLQPHFREFRTGSDFTLGRYAMGVARELCMALGGLVGEMSPHAK